MRQALVKDLRFVIVLVFFVLAIFAHIYRLSQIQTHKHARKLKYTLLSLTGREASPASRATGGQGETKVFRAKRGPLDLRALQASRALPARAAPQGSRAPTAPKATAVPKATRALRETRARTGGTERTGKRAPRETPGRQGGTAREVTRVTGALPVRRDTMESRARTASLASLARRGWRGAGKITTASCAWRRWSQRLDASTPLFNAVLLLLLLLRLL